MAIFYFFVGIIYLKYIISFFLKNNIIKFLLGVLAFPTLVFAPFAIFLVKRIFLYSSYKDEIFEVIGSFGFNLNWLIAIFSFVFFLRFVPKLWIFDYKNKTTNINNVFLKVHFPFKLVLIVFGIEFLLAFGDLLYTFLTNTNEFLYDRDSFAAEQEAELLSRGRGVFSFLWSILQSAKFILISHIINIQKFKKVYNLTQFKIIIFTFFGTSLITYLIQLSSTSSRIGMVLPLVIIFFQYKFIFSDLPIRLNNMKFRIIYLLYAVILFSLPVLFSILSFFRKGVTAAEGSFNFLLNSLHGLGGFMTISEFAVIYSQIRSQTLNFEFGYSFFLDFIQFVPRFIYPDKPITSFSYRLSQKIYDLSYDNPSTWVHTFTPWGEGYLQFSSIGVIMASILLVILITLAINFVNKYKIFTFNFLFIFLPTFITTFRADLSSGFGRFYEFFFFSMLGYFFLIAILQFIPLSKAKIVRN